MIPFKAAIGLGALALALAGCGSSYKVDVGPKGDISPAESGQYGQTADQAPPYGAPQTAEREHDIRPIDSIISNDFTDPSMEGSGNIAAQGNYAEVAKQPRPLPLATRP